MDRSKHLPASGDDLRRGVDEERRRELEDRRKAAKQRLRSHQERAPLRRLLDTLEAADEPHQFLRTADATGWTPAWVPYGYTRVAWEKVWPTISCHFGFHDDPARKPLIEFAILQRTQPGEMLLLVVDGRGGSLRMPRETLLRHLDAILAESPWEIWITAPPAQWLVEIKADQVYVGDGLGPPELNPD